MLSGGIMTGWKEQAKHLFFDLNYTIIQVADEIKISRQTVSGFLKTLPEYEDEIRTRKEKSKNNRKEYKKEKNREYRCQRSAVTQETMRREHEVAVMILSHEKYYH
ncbi:MAG: hypothetical protein PHX08_01860 [Lachnospiraceae bacterium]|nr:hypothetical protein [Lachnospiraceae bacterium]